MACNQGFRPTLGLLRSLNFYAGILQGLSGGLLFAKRHVAFAHHARKQSLTCERFYSIVLPGNIGAGIFRLTFGHTSCKSPRHFSRSGRPAHGREERLIGYEPMTEPHVPNTPSLYT